MTYETIERGALTQQQAVQQAEMRSFPRPADGVATMLPALLLTNLFDTSPRAEGYVRETLKVRNYESIDGFSDRTVSYQGPRLTQFHKRVLLALLDMSAGQQGNVELHFRADEFLAGIGKDSSTNNINALREALADLRSATFVLRLFKADKGCAFGFVLRADWDGRKVVVQMDGKAASAFWLHGRTYLPMAKRNQLADGVPTALADLIHCARQETFSLKDLAEMWGQDPYALAKYVDKALPKLVEAGVISNYTRSRGKFTVQKAPLV